MLRSLLALILLCVFIENTHACLIFCMKTDSTILVGNHEDWFAKDAAIRIIPPEDGNYGSVVFTFMNEGWAQGGMNEKGLFFDGAFTPFQEISFDTNKQKFQGYIWQEVLNKCATVEEAINFLSNYKLTTLEEAHILLADAKGHAVILGVNQNKVAIKRIIGDYLLQTNFNPWQPELSDEEVCNRFNTATGIFSKSKNSYSRNTALDILKSTHQDSLTVYSNIYDLKNKKITTYFNRKFNKPIEVSLPQVFEYGSSVIPLENITDINKSLEENKEKNYFFMVKGKLLNQETNQPIPFANIGFVNKNKGTLSDPDGSFELFLPIGFKEEILQISCIGYEKQKVNMKEWEGGTLKLTPKSIVLNEINVRAKKATKVVRLGWMGGKDGIVPFDTLQGGATAALLINAPQTPFFVKKIQFRLLYNSKDTLRFRLHFFEYDSVNDCPGKELMNKQIILKADRRFGWVRIDLEDYNLNFNEEKFFLGLEWMDTQSTRKKLQEGLKKWDRWKAEQYIMGNSKVELLRYEEGVPRYKYHGNMMNWSGFEELPPWTGLMIETGKTEKTKQLRTFQRKTSFGKWKELDATLNVVLVISY